MKNISIFFLLLVTPLSAKPFVSGARLDHVGVAVRDLDRSRADYETLGFQVQPGGHFPGGASNAIIDLDDHFYLELITAPDDAKGDDATIIQFAKAHEGAMYFGLNVSSAKDTADGLKAHNFDVQGPTPGSVMSEHDTTPPAPQWYSVDPADKPAAEKRAIALPMFFIEYVPAPNDHRTPSDKSRQPNYVVGVRAIWIGVHDLVEALAAMREQGFRAPGRFVSLDGLEGRATRAGTGDLNLVKIPGEPGDPNDYRILGVTLIVSDFEKSRAAVEAATKMRLRVYHGAYGLSLSLPVALTHGLRVELVDRHHVTAHQAQRSHLFGADRECLRAQSRGPARVLPVQYLSSFSIRLDARVCISRRVRERRTQSDQSVQE